MTDTIISTTPIKIHHKNEKKQHNKDMKEKKLKAYHQKRNFQKTNEPKGKKRKSKKKGPLQFVVQWHDATKLHFDFRLEYEGVLFSFAIPKGPSFNPLDKRLAIQVEDHPLDYATFEGVIPKGQYGGGTVLLWDQGEYEVEGLMQEELKKGVLKLTLNGKRLKGKWTLVRINKDHEKKQWLLIKEKDQYAKKTAGISRFKTSILSQKTMKEIAKNNFKNPFSQVDVQLAELKKDFPKEKGWLYEIKYDGYRIIAFIEKDKVQLKSRNQKDYSTSFEDVIPSLIRLANHRSMVLDGEMVILDQQGVSHFQDLQQWIKKKNDSPLTYVLFDILALDGKDLRNLPLIQRKEILAQLIKEPLDHLLYSQHVIDQGKQLFAYAQKYHLEGIMGKKMDSSYHGHRSEDWIKIKCYHRQEFVIGGYTFSEKKDRPIKALLLGVYENKQLQYVGKVGTGLSQKMQKDFLQRLKEVKGTKNYFSKAIKSKEKIVFLKPKYMAEVQFAEWTKEGLLRQASFKGLREDKKVKDVFLEQDSSNLVIQNIPITNPNKIVFAKEKIKKIDIIQYYDQISTYMLPYLQNRFLSVVCCPKGTNQCFFKKHLYHSLQGVKTKTIQTNNQKETYFYIQDTQGIVAQAQLGTIEFHCWGSQVQKLSQPDIMVFDLDPDEKLSLAQVRQGVKDLKQILDELSLVSFLKTSGNKGYHVVVPFQAKVKWEKFRDFARHVAQLMEQKWPDRYTANMQKNQRKNKIFIDWMRNIKKATSVAPYSIRVKNGRVSVPISYQELKNVTPDQFTMEDVLMRIKTKKDPWNQFFDIQQTLQ